jgi:enterobacterial common antigen flippase
MKSILRATAVLGSSSIVTILVGLVSAKAYALLLGPAGTGYMGLLQSLLGIAGLMAGMGIGTGVVRMGAKAAKEGDELRVTTLRRAAWLLVGLFGAIILLVMTLLRGPLSRLMLGETAHPWDVVLMGVAVIFFLAAGLQIKILNTHHRVNTLAKWGILNSILGTLASLLCIWFWGTSGIAASVIAATAINWLISRYFVSKEVAIKPVKVSRPELLSAAKELLRFGAPFTASMLFGMGVQFILPVLILNTLDQESVGFYRAAVAISVGYLGFLLTAMAQDYYPRISAITDHAKLKETVNEQHKLIMLLGVPMIFGAFALSQYLVTLVYSPEFSPAVGVLEWQLLGNLFQFSSWTMSFVVLAHCKSRTYFLTEVAGGLSMLLCSWFAMQVWGLTGLGVGFMLSYILYFLVVWLINLTRFKINLSLGNWTMLLSAFCLALAIQALPLVGLQDWRLILSLSIAFVFGFRTLFSLYKIVLKKEPSKEVPMILKRGEHV